VAAILLRETGLLVANRSRELRAGRDHLVRRLGEELPEWSLHVPDGGMTLWINTETTSTSALALAARAEGLAIVPGPRFGLDGVFERFLRLPFSYGPEELDEAVGILARAARRAGGTELRVPLQSVI
jgi:DNA-binding transcriptional MocR family regulator